jgi:hypothetical protein
MGALVLLYLVWSVFITPLFSGLDFPSLIVGLLECLAKTLVLCTLGVLAVYFWKVSPDANTLIEKTVSVFIKKNNES